MNYNIQYSNTTQIGGRFGNIDMLKAMCAFLVVCIHAPFTGLIGEYITAFARIAVPIFFMITGFFFQPERIKRQIIKTVRLIITASSIYFLWQVMLSVLRNNLGSYLSSTFTFSNIVKFVIFNDNRFGSHLWYLKAILYVIVVAALLRKGKPYKWKKILYAITPVLLVGDLAFGKYSLIIFGMEFPYILVRNWLFVGIPYFTLGIWIKENETAIITKMGKRAKLICGLGIFLFSATTVLERWLLVSNSVNATRDHYLSTTFLSIAVFLYFLLSVWRNENWFSKIGKKNSTWIYILHPMVITVMGVIASRISVVQNIYVYIRPVVIFTTTTVMIKLGVSLKEKIVSRLP